MHAWNNILTGTVVIRRCEGLRRTLPSFSPWRIRRAGFPLRRRLLSHFPDPHVLM